MKFKTAKFISEGNFLFSRNLAPTKLTRYTAENANVLGEPSLVLHFWGSLNPLHLHINGLCVTGSTNVSSTKKNYVDSPLLAQCCSIFSICKNGINKNLISHWVHI